MAEQKYEVFISHRAEDRSIANSLKNALGHLSKYRLEIHIWEETQGGTDWRDWIEKQIDSSKIMVFLYSDSDADWRWCLYELGLFRGKNKSAQSGIICIKNLDIPKPPSPIENFQSYNADKDGIKRFFSDMVYKPDLFGERLNDELYANEDMKKAFDVYVDQFVRYFIQSVKTEFFAQRIAITLSKTVGEEIQVADLDEAGISGSALTMSLLNLPEINVRWRDIYASFHGTGQSAWLDHLSESIERIRKRQQFNSVMRPFTLSDDKTFIPVVSRVETFRVKDTQGTVIPKRLFVIFIPMQEDKIVTAHTLRDMSELLRKWITYLPSSVVRVKWRKRSTELEYLEEDIREAPVVCAINPAFAQLFDFNYDQFPSPNGNQKLTTARLLERIKDYVAPNHFDKLTLDQTRVFKRIVLQNKDDMAVVPLQLNAHHPHYKNEMYLPYLISKQLIGEISGPHETYLLVCYVRDFWPLDHPQNPYHEAQ